MGKLIVNYSALDDLKSTIKKANNYFDKRNGTVNRVRTGVNGVSSSRGYLGDAVNQLYGKSNEIEDKQNKLNSLSDDIVRFKEEAQAADKRVADRINSTTKSFCYVNGIGTVKTEEKSVLQKLKDWASDRWKDVKNFYEENKETILAGLKLVANVAFCALAVVTFIATLPASGFFAICGAVAAGFALAKSVGDVVTSAISFGSYAQGDKANGAAWAERGLKDGMLYVGRKADEFLNTNCVENFMGKLYTGLEVFSAVYAVADLGKGIAKAFKLDKLKWGKLFKGSFKQRTAWFKSINWKGKFLSKDNWKSLGKTLIGIKKTPHGASKEYQKLKKSFSFIKNTTTITAIAKFKARGTNIKMIYKTIENIFDGDPDTKWCGEIKAIKTLDGLNGKVIEPIVEMAN